jgi:hypothetical protein
VSQQITATSRQSRGDVWVRRGCALLVAAVAAYSSYAHQRHFALAGGADQVSAALWPLSVDGLVVLASLGLVRAQSNTTTRARLALWVAFLLGVAVSLAANIAAAPVLGWQPVLVAGWPPLALLLAVELVVHSHSQDQTSTAQTRPETTPVTEPEPETGAIDAIESAQTAPKTETETAPKTNRRTSGPAAARRPRRLGNPSAEAVMWDHFQTQHTAGRTPSGAELDRVAGTNNYGRAVLARWRESGRIPATAT